MVPLLYLTPTEQQIFAELPADVRGDWEGAIETDNVQDAEETDEQLQTRRAMFREHYPEDYNTMKELSDKLDEDPDTDVSALTDMSDEQFTLHMFAVGVSGLSTYIELSLMEMKHADDLSDLAYLSRVRHALAEANRNAVPA